MQRRRSLLPLVGASILIAPILACGFGGDEEPAAPVTPAPAPAVGPTDGVEKAPAPAPPADEGSEIIGTRHLAHFQGSGFAYPAVVTATYGDGTVGVVYADGDTERVSPDALFPEQIAVGTRVEARLRSWPRFYPGRVGQRVAHAVFVEFEDGDREWTSLGLVRMPVSGLSRDAPAAPAPEPSGTPPAVGSAVLANFHGEGWFYPAVIQATEGDRVHVIYADGDRETLPVSSVRPDDLRPGSRVQARPRGSDAPTEGIVVRRVGHAVELRLEDGSKVWAALPNVRMR